MPSFPVVVMLERRPTRANKWVDHIWSAIGVTTGKQDYPDGKPQLIRQQDDIAHYLVSGLSISLHADECESYYNNLRSPTPRCYVIAHPQEHEGDDDMPIPFRVSMSFDEAHAYLEGEDEIYAVDIPPELYRWTEAFVIDNYFPEKKQKRKLKDWNESEGCAS